MDTAAARIVRILVGREKKHTRIVKERALGAIAVVQVLFNPYRSFAYAAAMATLLKRQKPMPRSGSAWWPGGRTKAKTEFGVWIPEFGVPRSESTP
jgi:hypothetical protein